MLFVFARPVDAVRLAGGTIALTADSGATTTVLTALPGSADGRTDAAMRLIGVRDHRTLGSAGARMGGAAARRYGESGSADSLGFADPGEVAADIATVIAAVGASTVIGDSVDSDDPDGAAIARATRHAAAVMDAEHSSVDRTAAAGARTAAEGARISAAEPARTRASDPETVDIDVRAALDRKRDAMIALGGDAASVLDVESFVSEPRFPAEVEERPIVWAEFGLGTRITSVVIGLVLGAVVGALGTVVFQSDLVIQDVPVPVGLIGCLLVITAILVGLRLVFETRVIAVSAAIGLLGMIGLFSLESPGGSVLIPDAVVSYYWIYGPVVIAFVVLAWPDLSRLRRVSIANAQASKGSPLP